MAAEFQIPSNFVLHYSPEMIRTRVVQMGDEIGKWAAEEYRRTGTQLLAIPVLRGGIFFFTDLVRELGISVDIAPVRTWAYDATQNTLQHEIKVNLDGVAAERRSVLIIDDIATTGATLNACAAALYQNGAEKVYGLTLARAVHYTQS